MAYSNATYIVSGNMAGDVTGDWINVHEQGRLRLSVSWASTGSPVGTLSLEYLAQDGTAKTIPGASAEFTTQPNSNAASLVCYWRELQVFERVRLKYTRGSGGTANTSLTASYRTV